MRSRGIITVSTELWKQRRIRRALKREVNVIRTQPSFHINAEELLCESYKFDPVQEGHALPHYNLIIQETGRPWPWPSLKVVEIQNLNTYKAPKMRKDVEELVDKLMGGKK